jgi:hypothetical protein
MVWMPPSSRVVCQKGASMVMEETEEMSAEVTF